MDTFTQAYAECALWASMDDNNEPLDTGDYELAPETRKSMEQDCADFRALVERAGLSEAMHEHWGDEQAGHDFWLTRNGHGAGFWDRSPCAYENIGERLSELAKTFGWCDLYVGDDGLIYSC